MHTEWTATPAQQQTLDRLMAAYEGGLLVRALPDGSLEVLTERRGALGRHVLGTDGSARCSLRPDGILRHVHRIRHRPRGAGRRGDATWWTIVPMLVGFAGLFVGLALMPGPHQLTERGERWAKVGFPEE